jgi:chromate transporter
VTTTDSDAPAKVDCDPALLASIFLRLGVTAFGGPAAHIAMMRSEFVDKRQWISEKDYLDIVGACNLLPGPSSTEVAIFIGLRLVGWLGLVLAGVCFILPAALLVSAFAFCYVHYGRLPATAALLYGIKPVVIAIIALAVYSLGRTALKSMSLVCIAVADLAASVFAVSPLLLLGLSGLAFSLPVWISERRLDENRRLQLPATVLLIFSLPILFSLVRVAGSRHHLPLIFLEFVKLGSVVFGSGYVLLAFLRTELVIRLHWLTMNQLLDAITVGQFTPGPVFTTATFIGYLLHGPAGAIAATLAIFLPAFFFVAAAGTLVRRLRSSPTMAAFLDGVNAAAVALMAYAGYQLAVTAIRDAATFVIAVASFGILMKYRINSAWLILAGAVFGIVLRR